MTRSRGFARDARPHPVHLVHRIGSSVLGASLIVFGVLGLVDMPTFFGPGAQTMGMGSNGALAVLSVVVGVLLLAAAARSGRASSTTSVVMGTLFLLSGFVHLAILDTEANVLAFGLPNVFFSFGAGVVLLTLGAYGRISGGLAADNPYARQHATKASFLGDPHGPHDPLIEAEEAAATGRATFEQDATLRAHRVELAGEHRHRSWRDFAATHSEAEVISMRSTSAAESAVEGRYPAP